MEIQIRNLTKRQINLKNLKTIAELSASSLNLKGQVSIVLVASQRIRKLNKQWRAKDKSTDVLSFKNLDFYNKKKMMAEIFINLDDCQKKTKYRDFFDHLPSRQDILYYLLIHGLLHLAGWSDDDELKQNSIIIAGRNIFKKAKKAL